MELGGASNIAAPNSPPHLQDPLFRGHMPILFDKRFVACRRRK
jgi:hypothetical protein